MLMTPDDFLRSRPKRICMVGLGPSANAYWLEVSSFDDLVPWEQVWAVNKAARAFAHDVCFHMHDLRDLCAKYPKEKIGLLAMHTPIMTVKAYPEFPTAIEYPIQDVLRCIQHDLLNSTPACMVAYAMLIGAKELWLYGMDFHYENLQRAEAGGQGMAYMLGLCQATGITYRIPSTSSLLDACKVQIVNLPDGKTDAIRPLYGYCDSSGAQDPRVPAGATVQGLEMAGQMSAPGTPRYRLGEAEEGDRPSADGRPARVPEGAVHEPAAR